MPIRQKSSRARRVIEIIDRLPEVSMSLYDDLIRDLTPEEITQITRRLNANHPEFAELLRESHRLFPRDWKFDIRQIVLGAVVASAGDCRSKLRKL